MLSYIPCFYIILLPMRPSSCSVCVLLRVPLGSWLHSSLVLTFTHYLAFLYINTSSLTIVLSALSAVLWCHYATYKACAGKNKSTTDRLTKSVPAKFLPALFL